jgi:hypothetical protein
MACFQHEAFKSSVMCDRANFVRQLWPFAPPGGHNSTRQHPGGLRTRHDLTSAPKHTRAHNNAIVNRHNARGLHHGCGQAPGL